MDGGKHTVWQIDFDSQKIIFHCYTPENKTTVTSEFQGESIFLNLIKAATMTRCCCLSESHLYPVLSAGVSSNQVIVPEKVNAVLGKNITLGCRIEVGSNLTQSSWERRLPSGTITLAVFNPEFGTSFSPDYIKRISFVSPSVRDATITIEGAGFADVGSYTCKVVTFPLGNTQASTYVNVLGKV